ncbi:hypothetical protein C6503_10140 [Candidatus Poribacteria bacterium]|nr:MAG: hypothetical protein C6503_10140 [Candidatus Poribacteria bacterium]
MKRHLSFLREVHQRRLSDASYSTVRACVASLVFVLLSINCGPAPKGQYYVPESAIAAAEKNITPQSKQNQPSLPENAFVRLQERPYVGNAFKEPPNANTRGGLDDFYAKTRGTAQHAAIISNCSFDVLKAFIAKGWVPIVKIEFSRGRPEILPLTRYSDAISEVYFQNPASFSERRLSYKDFETSWATSSRNKCVLITPQQLADSDLEKVLGRYLPKEAFQQISMRSR